jgi:hypothetical protein
LKILSMRGEPDLIHIIFENIEFIYNPD